MTQLTVNGATHVVEADKEKPLLWVLREDLALTGTKYACTVHVNGEAQRSCVLPLAAALDAKVTTIEGLSADGTHALQQAWQKLDVPQCGYCQSGMLMAAAALLARNPAPTDADIDAAITNLCRCGTYVRIRAGIHRAAATLRGETA
jgi:isoquinoline 1-oxidoreductase subunit alpha